MIFKKHIKTPLLYLVFAELLFGHLAANVSFANNTSYITLSNQITRKKQLDMIANNVANANTVGYEQDDILLRKVDVRQNSKRTNSFVWAETTYKSGETGPLKMTNRPTDVAIGGRGYFKLFTPRGERYTLDGSMIINSQNIIVNNEGFPYSNSDGGVIEMPADFKTLDITEDGTFYVDNEAVDRLGVFDFKENDPFIKEGSKLYKASGNAILLEDFTIISGALRASNVSSAMAMAKMIEMQRAVGMTNNLMSDVTDLERSVINKIPK
jgi:flagellar basal-body rod protein FlgF